MSVAQAEPDVKTTSVKSAPLSKENAWLQELGWWTSLVLIVTIAFGLRIWGNRHGMPFAYNADEHGHFVPIAIGMFDHSLNPGYFLNPPGLTYVLHIVFAITYGGNQIQDQIAIDPGKIFILARFVVAAIATCAVPLIIWAGVRFFDRVVGLIAGLLLAVSFLPVFYGHLALNDAVALTPVALALVGCAGVFRRGRPLDWIIAGIGIGFAAATKYTAGITALSLVAAGVLTQARIGLALRVFGCGVSGIVAAVAFLLANPYSILDFKTFFGDISRQSSTSSDGGGKLGLTEQNGFLYYMNTLTWGFGWAPAIAAGIGAGTLVFRSWRVFAVLAIPPAAFLAFMGAQDRFFARWLLPIYPYLCLLAAVGCVFGVRYLCKHFSRSRAFAFAGLCLVPIALSTQGLIYSIHNDQVLARPDTRQVLRDWMVKHVPEGERVVLEPIFPDAWATDVGRPSPKTTNGARWVKWPTLRAPRDDHRARHLHGTLVPLEDYERITHPRLIDSYLRGGYCWVVTGSTQFGRALAEPTEVPNAIRYYGELRKRGTVVFETSPFKHASDPVPFSFDFSFNSYPLAYHRPGPKIVVYRLYGGKCGLKP